MSPGQLALARSFWFGGLSYSPARMVAADSSRSRESDLERVRARILAAARRSLSPEDAEDLAQEALLVLTAKYADVEALEELVALGVGILRRKRSAYWRKAQRRREAGDVPPPVLEEGATDPLENVADPVRPDPEAITSARERVRLLAQAAGALTGRCRDLLRRKVEGQSFVEIAAFLEKPVNTVYSWDHRCHKQLKKLLGPRWGFVSGKEES